MYTVSVQWIVISNTLGVCFFIIKNIWGVFLVLLYWNDWFFAVFQSRTLEQLKKHLSGHVRLRLSISTRDLCGKTVRPFAVCCLHLFVCIFWSRQIGDLINALNWIRSYCCLLSVETVDKAFSVTGPCVCSTRTVDIKQTWSHTKFWN